MDDPKVRQPDITRARDDARLGAEGAGAGRAVARTIEYFAAHVGTPHDGAAAAAAVAAAAGGAPLGGRRSRQWALARRRCIFPGFRLEPIALLAGISSRYALFSPGAGRHARCCCWRPAIPNSSSRSFTTNEALYRAAMEEF